VAIQTLIPFADKAEIRESIREDCGLSTKLSRAISERAEKKEIPLQRVGNLEKEGGDHSLELRITDTIEPRGGVFPSASLSIDGVLKRGGKITGTFVATRFAKASLFPFVHSDCAILAVAVDMLAKDVVKWLNAPRVDSRIGDSR